MIIPIPKSLDSASATGSHTPVLTISPSNSATLSLTPGNFSTVSQTIDVSTTNRTGYTLTFKANGESTSLTNISNNAFTIPSIVTTLQSTDFDNNYGYSTNGGTTYSAVPLVTADEIATTNAANSIANTYTLTFGAIVDTSVPSGTYQKTFTVMATANPCDFLIFYDKNTEDTVSNMPSTDQVAYDATQTTITTTVPIRNEYTFLGWSENENALAATYQPGDTMQLSSNTEIYLYAIWQEDTCDAGYICYFGNRADAGTMADQAATSNTETILIPSNFSKNGYGFAGWNTLTDGTGTNYGPNATITTGDISSEGMKLYAKWIQSAGNMQTWTGCSNLATGAVTALKDTRDNNVYAIAKLADGKCWMIENLRLDPGTANITANNTNGPTTDFLSATSTAATTNTFCSPDSSACDDKITYNARNLNRSLTPSYDTNTNTSAWYSYGIYYNWFTATAGNGTYSKSSGVVTGDICPAGWRLPTGNTGGEYKALNDAANNGITNADAVLRDYPVNFVWSGDFGGSDVGQYVYGRIWSATAAATAKAYRMGYGITTVTPVKNWNKYMGFVVRCLYQGGNTFYNDVTVTLGTGISSITFYHEDYGSATVSISGSTISLVSGANYTITANPTLGYGFTSWATGSNGTLGDDDENPTTYTVSDDTTLSVTGTAIPTYTVTVNMDSNSNTVGFYNATYGVQQATSNGDTVTLYEGIEYTISPSFASGYTFDSWTTTANGTLGSTTTAATTYTVTGTATLTLTSKVQVEDEYTLTYNIDTGIDGPESEVGYSASGSYTFTLSNVIPYKPGYSFVGWSETPNSPTAEYTGGDSYTTSNQTNILYAVWLEDTCPSGYICYFGNRADEGTMSNQAANSNANVNLIPSNFSKSGYGFAGWNTAADGTGTNYGPNAAITTPNLASAGLKLYAKWIASAGNLHTWKSCSSLANNTVTALTDVRDNNTYAVAKLADGNCWIIENLRLDLHTATITAANTHNPTAAFITQAGNSSSQNTLCNTPDTSACIDIIQYNSNNLNRNLTQSYNTAGNSVAWYSYGVYYNWYAATAGNGTLSTVSGTVQGDICPAGWHIPTGNSGEWVTFNAQANSGRTNTDAGLRSYPNNLLWSGDYNNNQRKSGYSNGRIWSATAFSDQNAYRMGYASNTVTPNNNYNKWDAFTVRCIFDGNNAQFYDVTVTIPTNGASVTFNNSTYGTVTATSENPTVQLAENAEYEITASTAVGYKLNSWTTGANGTLGSASSNPTTFTITDDTTLEFSVTARNTYTVTVVFDTGGSSVGFYNLTYTSQQATTSNNTVSLYEGIEYTITPSFNNPYTFDTWATTANGTLGSTTTAATTYTITGNTTLTLTSRYMDQIQNLDPTKCTSTAEKVYDNRDNSVYTIQRLADGNCWMMENLDLGRTTLTTDLTSSNTNISSTVTASTFNGWKKTTPTYSYSGGFVTEEGIDDTTNTPYGTLYNYASTTGGTVNSVIRSYDPIYDICPAGWRLPTSNEFITLYNTTAYNTYAKMRNPFNAGGAAFNLSGSYTGATSNSTKTNGGYYWSSNRNSSANSFILELRNNTSSINTSSTLTNTYYSSIRCIKKNAVHSLTVNYGTGVAQITINDITIADGSTINLEEGTSYVIGMTPEPSYGFNSWTSTSGTFTPSRTQYAYYQIGTTNATVTANALHIDNSMQDQRTFSCTTTPSKVKDIRDNRVYTIQLLKDGNCWMMENLDLGRTTISTNLTSSNTNLTNTVTSTTFNEWIKMSYSPGMVNSKPIVSPIPGGDPISGNAYGSLYSFDAMDRQGVTGTNNFNKDLCPAGWTTASETQYRSLTSSDRYPTYEDLRKPATSGGVALSLTAGVNNMSSPPVQQGLNGTYNTKTRKRQVTISKDGTYNFDTNVSTLDETRGAVRCILKSTTINDLTYLQDFDSLSAKQYESVYDSMSSNTVYELIDNRDNKTYQIAKLDFGNIWLAENLDLGRTTLTTDLTSSNTNIATTIPAATFNSWKKTSGTSTLTDGEFITLTGNDSVNSTPHGTLYNYYAATGGTISGGSFGQLMHDAMYDICPAGWELPTIEDGKDYGQIIHKQNPTYDGTTIRDTIANGGASHTMSGEFSTGAPTGLNEKGRYWTYENYYESNYVLNMNAVTSDTLGSRAYGYSIRCKVKSKNIYPVTIVYGEGIASVTINGVSVANNNTINLELGRKYNYRAEVENGYTFNQWTLEGANSINGSQNQDPTIYTTSQNATVTASATPQMQIIKSSDCTSTVKTVIDSRDSQSYKIKRLADGNCWMLDNLSLGSTTLYDDLTSDDTNIPDATYITDTTFNSWKKTVSANTYTAGNYIPVTGTDSTSQTRYGVLYNYYAASAGTISGSSNNNEAEYDICPAGWRMPTKNEFDDLLTSYSSSYSNMRSSSQAALAQAGFFSDDEPNEYYGPVQTGSVGYYWTKQKQQENNRYVLVVNSPSGNIRTAALARNNGASIRCILKPMTISKLAYMQDFNNLSANDKTTVLASMVDSTTYNLIDNRDNKTYAIAKMKDGKVWMAENLDLGRTNLTTDLTSSNTNLSTTVTASTFNSWKKTTGSGTYNAGEYINISGTDPTSGTPYGTLYNYHAASAGTISGGSNSVNASYDICPAGWRLPTGGSSGDSQALYDQYNFNALMRAPITDNGAAFALAGSFYNAAPVEQGYDGGYWSSTMSGIVGMRSLSVDEQGHAYPNTSVMRSSGLAIRCVAK
ncbi:InlB B-repeat-containing protein [Candidatus Saccharibacteria bacterium]|nr:InlB B-repeat-containing protein [Candidatus Saccharibacteria bacterium]